MKRKLLSGLATGLYLVGMVGVASVTTLFSMMTGLVKLLGRVLVRLVGEINLLRQIALKY